MLKKCVICKIWKEYRKQIEYNENVILQNAMEHQQYMENQHENDVQKIAFLQQHWHLNVALCFRAMFLCSLYPATFVTVYFWKFVKDKWNLIITEVKNNAEGKLV